MPPHFTLRVPLRLPVCRTLCDVGVDKSAVNAAGNRPVEVAIRCRL